MLGLPSGRFYVRSDRGVPAGRTRRDCWTRSTGGETAVEAANRLDVEDVDPDEAREAAALLDLTAPQLAALRMQLKRRSTRRE